MKFRHLIVLAACLAYVASPGPAMAQKPGDGASDIVVRVCNNTNDNARVALSYQPVGSAQFYNEGWYGVPSRSCQDLVRTGNAYIYGYAEVENNGALYWSGDHPLCVEYPGPYAFWTGNSTYCAAHQELRNFVVLHAEDFGTFTWDLNY
jgi:uncharacterized membrane protein